MKLEIYCCKCGKEKTLELKKKGFDPEKTIRHIIMDARWIVQINGRYFDIYCSKRCAV